MTMTEWNGIKVGSLYKRKHDDDVLCGFRIVIGLEQGDTDGLFDEEGRQWRAERGVEAFCLDALTFNNTVIEDTITLTLCDKDGCFNELLCWALFHGKHAIISCCPQDGADTWDWEEVV